jgi:hypothetical protein
MPDESSGQNGPTTQLVNLCALAIKAAPGKAFRAVSRGGTLVLCVIFGAPIVQAGAYTIRIEADPRLRYQDHAISSAKEGAQSTINIAGTGARELTMDTPCLRLSLKVLEGHGALRARIKRNGRQVAQSISEGSQGTLRLQAGRRAGHSPARWGGGASQDTRRSRGDSGYSDWRRQGN